MTAVAFPFRGVVCNRPYPPTGLTTARWAAEVPVAEVDLSRVWLTQGGVNIAALFGHTIRESDEHPHVVVWRGELYLEDGHHRAVRAALRSTVTHMTARVFEHTFRPHRPMPDLTAVDHAAVAAQ